MDAFGARLHVENIPELQDDIDKVRSTSPGWFVFMVSIVIESVARRLTKKPKLPVSQTFFRLILAEVQQGAIDEPFSTTCILRG